MKKYIYSFGDGHAEGNGTMKDLLGCKGAGLAEMNIISHPVPACFTITTEDCTYYYAHDRQFPQDLEKSLQAGVAQIEKIMGSKFGDSKNPLLLSVRSGARASMPGMMDTILNLGLNEETVRGLGASSGNPGFAKESFARLKTMYEEVVGESLPQDPWKQLLGAVGAVFRSWQSKRAIEYRRINRIPGDWGTACNVQAMVFGNMGEDSGTGVCFSRNPSTGENKFYGEFLANAQGEDVVAGIRTPEMLDDMHKHFSQCHKELVAIREKLEKHFRDMQDMEFTVQRGKLWMLQCRTGKRTAKAAIRIAVEMVDEKLITKEEALLRINPEALNQLLHPMVNPAAHKKVLTKGLPASPGAAVGRVVFTADDAVAWAEKKETVILVRAETSPEDIHGMNVAQGILTSRGGMTSHAAVVARGMGKTCVAGCGQLEVRTERKEFIVKGNTVREGDWITIDGTSGEVMLGRVETIPPGMSGEFETFMGWADAVRVMKVRANADIPRDAEVAKKFGAEGIGLCRTEHMFFDATRLPFFRQMILADSLEAREKALAKIAPFQKEDFKGLFRTMAGLPVTIRLLDPPLHEFLPHTDGEMKELSQTLNIPVETLADKVESLKEQNPMLGHRGCRLGVTYPEIYAMQIRAVMEAACELVRDEKIKVLPEIEIPLVGLAGEIRILRELTEEICRKVMETTKQKVNYKVGTMIELPRAAFRSDAIAPYADFFSFGTNDLTQTTLGISRDDGFRFLPEYEQKGLLHRDPFQTIDFEGVGELMKVCIAKGRQVKPGLEIGICGEHGGDPESVEFCHQIGLDYVSCSPFRVPVARLAAAQAVLKEKKC